MCERMHTSFVLFLFLWNVCAHSAATRRRPRPGLRRLVPPRGAPRGEVQRRGAGDARWHRRDDDAKKSGDDGGEGSRSAGYVATSDG